MKGVKIRLSRTLVIVLGGLLFVGASGAAALYLGADKLLGPSYEEVNGLECTTLQLVKIKRDNVLWVRKYVFTSGGDGSARLKTALRVAKAVQASEHADLVQITVLDKSGPTQRAAMRGRAIGAQVVYIPDPAKAPDPSDPMYTAYYVEGAAGSNGDFYGLRIDPPLEDVKAMAASLNDTADCVSPVIETPAGHDSGHGAKTDKKDAHGSSDAHGKGDAHGKSDAHGEEKAPADAMGHDAAPPAEGAEKGDQGGESEGLISSLKGMIFGKPAEAVATAHGETPAAPDGQAVAAGDHSVPSQEHTAVTEEPGIFSRLKAMILGSDKPEVAGGDGAIPAAASDGHAPQQHGAASATQGDGIDPMKVAAPTEGKAQPDTAPQAAAPKPPAKVNH